MAMYCGMRCSNLAFSFWKRLATALASPAPSPASWHQRSTAAVDSASPSMHATSGSCFASPSFICPTRRPASNA
ncbi:hypothetical protein M885DRAFT_507638 [Pelagophyceae sp. CCMP2097]|nr:hypothetical protein M885DRAFT_543355 [Pelagophyceae sp. CCMP2097]KAJ1461549.1 hypothetical protein M885DRAFT_507638 [Pelagophyceae sp. CCMP2097]